MSNATLHTYQSINYSVPIEPLEEGNVVVEVRGEYDFTGGSDYDYHQVILAAKSMTYDELCQVCLLFQNLTYILLVSTIGVAMVATYVYYKKSERH